MKYKDISGAVLFAIIGIVVGLIQPFHNLEPLGHYIIGTVIITMGLWIFKPGGVPFMAGSTVLVAGGLIFGLQYDVVVSGFISSSVWILIPALYFGFALQKTGLGKRIAYLVLKSFKPSWMTMALSWLIIGIALSALTPSITVRIAIMMPIALGVIEACKLEYRSRGSAFISLICWAMCLFPGTGWLTGSLSGPLILGFLPAELKHLVTFETYFQILALPWMIITFVFVILVYLFMKPKVELGISKDTFKNEYKALGPVSRQEIVTACILLGTLIMFTTEKLHSIPAPAVALLALFSLLMFRIVEPKEIGTGANWDVIVFYGVTISLSTIFMAANIDSWVAPMLYPALLSLADSPLIFLLVATLVFFLIRLIDVPWGFSTIALTVGVLLPLFNQYGIHPLVSSFVYLAGINFFLLSYQQPWMAMAESVIENKGWMSKHIFVAGICYIVAVIVAIFVTLPYWQLIGVL
ncbi:SLC13 family permease [Alkalihalobacterium elongatum]|uniref:SLC13 family permease n=1 Tax=Alkalihalobacterium elongatum TaxID=2675466 RepID=UPI001C1F8257|nr:anion permease [Alkalihalobacterium elongatum]